MDNLSDLRQKVSSDLSRVNYQVEETEKKIKELKVLLGVEKVTKEDIQKLKEEESSLQERLQTLLDEYKTLDATPQGDSLAEGFE